MGILPGALFSISLDEDFSSRTNSLFSSDSTKFKMLSSFGLLISLKLESSLKLYLS